DSSRSWSSYCARKLKAETSKYKFSECVSAGQKSQRSGLRQGSSRIVPRRRATLPSGFPPTPRQIGLLMEENEDELSKSHIIHIQEGAVQLVGIFRNQPLDESMIT